jgi:phosphatidylserine/phosphatidylglycerophosphate/cardiolipin synthase-like enzyme
MHNSTQDNWWAEGDTPVHDDSRVYYLVDGRSTMFTLCRHFLMARRYIYIANWGFTPQMELVRGNDQRAGPDGSPEQDALVALLRATGLDEQTIAFWCSHKLTMQTVLGFKVQQGVEVKALLWDCSKVLAHYVPKVAYQELVDAGVTCILDDSARGLLHHPVESLHQKISIVDGTHAFVGGIDPLIELNGDFDRWDTPAHHFSNPLRKNEQDITPHPWHDAHAMIEGPAAADVEFNFRERWNDVVKRHHLDNKLLLQEHPPTDPLESDSLVQIARTIPEHTYSFRPHIIQGISQLYAKAFNNAQHLIYLENQYFWLHAYTGVDIPFAGKDSPEMERNISELSAALRRGVTIAFVLPDHPNDGRAFTDAAITRLVDEAPEAITQGRLQVFCLATSINREGIEHYRPIYVHAKVAIVDDLWSTVGSGNLNNRGMRDDTEMNVATLNADLGQYLRLMLWAEHLGLLREDDFFSLEIYLRQQHQIPDDKRATQLLQYLQETIGDPHNGLRMMIDQAQDNMRRYKANLPLIGQLLPYLTANEATQEGLNFREDHGWIEEE